MRELTKAEAAKAVGIDESDVFSFVRKPNRDIGVVTIYGQKLYASQVAQQKEDKASEK
jgi:hypothetical protein